MEKKKSMETNLNQLKINIALLKVSNGEDGFDGNLCELAVATINTKQFEDLKKRFILTSWSRG